MAGSNYSPLTLSEREEALAEGEHVLVQYSLLCLLSIVRIT